MPVETRVSNTKLQLKYNYGVDDKGENIIKSKTYANLSQDVTDQVIYEVATAMSALQANTLQEVHKVQDVMLIEV